MKAFIPLTLFALAGATSAAEQKCTFAYRSVATTRGEFNMCAFEVYLKPDAHVPDAGTGNAGPHVGSYYPDDCMKENLCHTASGRLGHEYDFCIDGKVGKDGTVDGGITVQRKNGTKVNIKPDGEEDVTDTQVTYWRGGIGCQGAELPPPAEPTK